MPTRFLERVVRSPARPLGLGIAVAAGFLAAEVLAVFALKKIAPENAFGALLLLGVLVVSAGWGFGLSIATSLASAAVYAYLHLEGRDSLAPALVIFLTLALLTNALVGQARLRAAEAEQRRREADLSADLARVMLRAPALGPALEDAGRRFADVLGLPYSTLTVGDGATGADEMTVALVDGAEHTGTLLVPRDLPLASVRRIHRMVPSLQALLAAACDREDITAELEASRRELERFFAVASDLLFIGTYVGGAAQLTRVNPAFERALGYSAAELAARPLTEFIHPDDRDGTAAALASVPQTDGATQFENRSLRRDGGVRWLEWNVVSDHGVLLGGARDVTERRREQDRLRVARTQQAALRRVATLVARGAPLSEIYDVAVTELAHSLGVNHVTLLVFEPDDHAVVRAALKSAHQPGFAVGDRLSLDGGSISEQVHRTGVAARIDDYSEVPGRIATRLRELGIRSAAGSPLTVDGGTRGVLVVGSHAAHGVPDGTEAHVGDFADLISTAIANAETRAELTASRARIVAAADEARRGFERDLHDGAQQRIVSLSLQLREAEAAVEGDEALRTQLSTVVSGLAGLHSDLQELSRGLHPAVLSRGGLKPAMRNLARRSTVPVELTVDVDRRLPEPVEVAAYYVVAESLTNVAKHAQADSVTVHVGLDDAPDGGTLLRLSVTDDGTGGASADGGSGLVGLRDRVEALSGQLTVTSRPGDGTSINATIPVD
ncbi:PAS domain S-box protein [Mycolicibacterium austroafricanum]|uniref:histidine kinase n=1 Tax=Mycolicibacterium austroafricanum TaxID=39687 RepID=A0ABT8HBK3_MYCAO|nr:PAS domain S-box protein [Mycolicibacterium austroafricanum]MDN4518158.1 PAS domain S-box protein [Mycolicibacterium austroafricanum]PQP47508.1 histidine kinase [Mycolicibacterium austroafricanum]QRZ09838.1 PAS domain S-box protein [Mycolicibacterium austroafricanum]QZT71288.1 PAS domain S-box protein [Mycolicibacterium austroafricanum]